MVTIMGYATTGNGTGSTWMAREFFCTTTAGDILNQLPPVTAAQISSNAAIGSLEGASSNSSRFQAPLTTGGNNDSGGFSSVLGIRAMPAFQ